MEYVDVLDEKGKKTGQTKPRSAVHRDGDWHGGADVWLLNSKGELLLQLRSKTKLAFPNYWDISAAGHAVAGDDSITTALKETREELGITLSPEQLELIGQMRMQTILNNGNFINNEFNDIYLARVDITEFHLEENGEVQEVQWVPWQTLQKWVKEQKPDLVPHPEEYRLLFKKLESLNL